MPSILNTPTNDIPIHFFCLPVAQREVLLVNVLTDPILYKSIVVKDASPTQMYSFLPASWVGDTHEETDFLPISDREGKRNDV